MSFGSKGGGGSLTANSVDSSHIIDGEIVNADVSSTAGISLSKLADTTTTDVILGRSSAGGGPIEEITCSSFGRSLIDDAAASNARTTLGLAIGTDVQAYDAGLADIAGLAVTDSNFIVGNGTNWVAETGATARTSLGLGSIATQASTSVDIDGGAIDGVTLGTNSAVTEADIDNININGNTISSTDLNGNINITPNGTGDLVLDGLNWPQADGTANYVLKTDGAGQLSWTANAGGGGGMGPAIYHWEAKDFDPLETNFAPLETVDFGTVICQLRAFDDTTEEYVNFKFVAPSNIDSSGTVTFRAYVVAKTAAASKNVGLTVGFLPKANGEAIDGTYTDEDSGAVAIDATQDDITIVEWTETVTNLGWVAEDLVLGRLSRDPSVTDDLTGDLYVLQLDIEVPRA